MAKFTDKPANRFPDLMGNVKNTQTHTHEHVHEQTPKRKKKELNDRRINLMMKPSTVEALDAYAEEQEISRNELIRDIIEKFLNDKLI